MPNVLCPQEDRARESRQALAAAYRHSAGRNGSAVMQRLRPQPTAEEYAHQAMLVRGRQ